MDKKESALLLIEDLTRNEGYKIITNSTYQKYLLENAIYFNIIGEEPAIAFKVERLDDNEKWWRKTSYIKLLGGFCDNIKDIAQPVKGANYVFVDNFETSIAGTNNNLFLNMNSSLTFFTIIGKEEVSSLKEIYKGDLSGKIKEAAETLGIKKDLEINYKQLIKEDPQKFCEYFKAVGDAKKQDLIREVMALQAKGHIDDKIKELLSNEEYKDVMLQTVRDVLGGKHEKR